MAQWRRFHPTLWLCLLASPACLASGGSYLVDDGAIATPGHCQLESWLQFRTSARSLTSVPACSWGAVEFSAQLTDGAHLGGGSATPGAKWQFANGPRVSAAVAVGTTWQRGRMQTAEAYVASTFLPDPDSAWAFNVNLGAARPRGERAQRLLGGGVEFAVSPSMTLLAEVLDTAGAGRTWQGGVRLPFGNDSIDLVVGKGLGQFDDRWINMGLNLAF